MHCSTCKIPLAHESFVMLRGHFICMLCHAAMLHGLVSMPATIPPYEPTTPDTSTRTRAGTPFKRLRRGYLLYSGMLAGLVFLTLYSLVRFKMVEPTGMLCLLTSASLITSVQFVFWHLLRKRKG